MDNFIQQLRGLPNYICECERKSTGVPKIWLFSSVDDDEVVIAKNKQVAILTHILQTFDTIKELKDYVLSENDNQNDQINTTTDTFNFLVECEPDPREFDLAPVIDIEFYLCTWVDKIDLDQQRNRYEFEGCEFLKYEYDGLYVKSYFMKRKSITDMTILTPTFKQLNKLFS